MAVLQGLAVGVGALGGWMVWRRLHEWEPEGDSLGESFARTGMDAADRVGALAEDTADAVAGVMADAIRIGGEVTAKSVGVTVHTVGSLAAKVRPASDDGATEPAAPKAPAEKKAVAKKTASTKRKTTTSKTKKTAARKAA